MAVNEIQEMKAKTEKLESHYKVIREDVTNINDNLKIIKDSLIGNPLSQDGGIIKRVSGLESKIDLVDQSVKKFEHHFKIITFVCSVLFVAIVTAFVKLYLNQSPN